MLSLSTISKNLLFDLMIGTKTMEELSIILNFEQKTLLINQIKLPMHKINSLQSYTDQHIIYHQNYYIEPFTLLTKEQNNSSKC